MRSLPNVPSLRPKGFARVWRREAVWTHRCAALLAVTVLVATAGCGSALNGAVDSAGGAGGLGSVGPTASAGAASSGVLAGTAGATAGTDTGTVGGALGAGGANSSASDQAGPLGTGTSGGGATTPGGQLIGKNGPGVTASSITVGIEYVTDTAAAGEALGDTAVTAGNTEQDAQIVVQDINDHGGLAGRKLIPIYDDLNATSAEPVDSQYQAVCEDFTQDHHVFAAVPGAPSGFGGPFNACMTHAGAVIGNATVTGSTEAEFNSYPNLYDVTAISLDRLSTNLVDTLVRANYFTPWDVTTGEPGQLPVKVGIIVPDTPEYAWVVPHVLLPALAAHGIHVSSADVYYYYYPSATSDDGQAIADIQTAELRFASDDVTHVIPLEVDGAVFFAKDAADQHYYPRYGLNSATGIQAYLGSLVTPAQMNGAVGLGFFPMTDLPSSMNPDNGPYSSPDRRHCVQIMVAGGQSFSSTAAEADALGYCDLLYTLRDVIDRIPHNEAINQATFEAALDGLGAVQSANLPEAYYGRGRHDPVDVGWVWEYFADCQCMHYAGRPFTLS
jgi:hypothetical protein